MKKKSSEYKYTKIIRASKKTKKHDLPSLKDMNSVIVSEKNSPYMIGIRNKLKELNGSSSKYKLLPLTSTTFRSPTKLFKEEKKLLSENSLEILKNIITERNMGSVTSNWNRKRKGSTKNYPKATHHPNKLVTKDMKRIANSAKTIAKSKELNYKEDQNRERASEKYKDATRLISRIP